MNTTQPHLNETRIVYFGTPEFSAYVLERLIEEFENPSEELGFHPGGGNLKLPRFVIQTVVTSPDKPVGRKQELHQSEVAQIAGKYGIPTLKPEKLDAGFIKANLACLDSDLFIVVSYGKIIPQSLLDIPRLGAINLHGSLLPKYRGASPIQQAILNGDQKTGVTIMLMDEKMDHGPILSHEALEISSDDNYQTLSTKMMQIGASILIKTIQNYILGKIKPLGQTHAIASYCNLIKKEGGFFDIDNPPSLEVLDRMIRAYYPWPMAWSIWKLKGQRGRGSKGQSEGRIVKFLPGQMVQMEGKKAVKLEEFLRGYPDFPIKKLA